MSRFSGVKIKTIWDEFCESTEEFLEARYLLRRARTQEEFLQKTTKVIKDRITEIDSLHGSVL